jgi:hypothetical protein
MLVDAMMLFIAFKFISEENNVVDPTAMQGIVPKKFLREYL